MDREISYSSVGSIEIKVFGLRLVREGRIPFRGSKINSPQVSARIISSLLKDRDRECVVILGVDVKLHPLGLHIAHVGTADNTPLHPREVFKFALRTNSCGVILGHNHPSGDPTPSEADRSITKKIAALGKELEIPLHDHIIVTYRRNRWVSFRETHPELFV